MRVFIKKIPSICLQFFFFLFAKKNMAYSSLERKRIHLMFWVSSSSLQISTLSLALLCWLKFNLIFFLLLPSFMFNVISTENVLMLLLLMSAHTYPCVFAERERGIKFGMGRKKFQAKISWPFLSANFRIKYMYKVLNSIFNGLMNLFKIWRPVNLLRFNLTNY